MTAEAGDRLPAVAQQAVDLGDLRRAVVAHLRLAHDLELGVVDAELVHHVDGVTKVPADAVADHAELHDGAPSLWSCAPTISSMTRVQIQLSPWGYFDLPA